MSFDENYIKSNLAQYEQIGWTLPQMIEKYNSMYESTKAKSGLTGDELVLKTLNNIRDTVKLSPPVETDFVFIGETHTLTKTNKVVCNAGLALVNPDGIINGHFIMTLWNSEATPMGYLQPRNIYHGKMVYDEYKKYKFVDTEVPQQVKQLGMDLNTYLQNLGIDRMSIRGCKEYKPKTTTDGKVINEKIFCFEGNITEPKLTKVGTSAFFNIYDDTELRPVMGEINNSGYAKKKGITCFTPSKYKDMLNDKNTYAIIGTITHKKEQDMPQETTFNAFDIICTFEVPEQGLEDRVA